ncbi:hypothetical protein BLSTO_04843 [Blastocystis sp. subtype 1]
MKGMCNDRDIDKLDLSACRNLVEWVVEEKCFQFVMELKMSGFACLESVAIGNECFTKGMGVFEMSHCDGLKSVRIGKGSFVHWSGFVLRDCGVEEVEIGDGCFVDCERVMFEDLARLRTLHLGNEVFKGEERKKNELVMQNLGELSELKGRMRALRNVKKVRLVNLPKLTVMVLRFAFVDVKELAMENASLLESHEVLGEVMRKKREKEVKERRKVRREWCGKNWKWFSISFIVSKLQQRSTFNHLSKCVGSSITKVMTELVVPSNGCNSKKMKMLDLRAFPQLKSIEIGDDCFMYVNKVKLIGLDQLESVVIGMNCFTKKKNRDWPENNPNHRFYLKNCERIRELKIGRYTFSDYSVCEIENVPSLEVIEMGELNEKSGNFSRSSLELKNLPSLYSLLFGRGAFCECSRAVFENLPELTSIQLGGGAFCFKQFDESSELIMRSLPKLTTLTTPGNSGTFSNPRIITLENMPSLTTVTLPLAFECRNELSYKNIGKLVNHPAFLCNPHANIHSVYELMRMNRNAEVLIVDNNACNDESFTELDLSSFTSLRVFEVGYYSFAYVNEVKLIGLNQLESVVIGMNCFTKCKYLCLWSINPDRHFYLKNCERIRELKMGSCSFNDYSVCEIENVPSLEVIEIGGLNQWNDNFWFASLELKNLPSLKSLLFGGYTFQYCSRVVFENLPELTSIQLGRSAFEFKDDESSELIMRSGDDEMNS